MRRVMGTDSHAIHLLPIIIIHIGEAWGKLKFMKKFIAFCVSILAFSASTVAAQNLSVIANGAELRFIPKDLVLPQSHTIFYEKEDEDGEYASCVLLDDSFQEVKIMDYVSLGTIREGQVREYLRPVWTGDTLNTSKQWEKEENWYEWENTPLDVYFYDAVSNCKHDDGYPFTQGIFNSDEKYEFIIATREIRSETTEEDRDRDGEIDYKYTEYYSIITGFRVVDEQGTVLNSITLPSGNWHYFENIDLWKTSTGYYLAFHGNDNEDESVGITIIYKVDSGSASIKEVNVFEGAMIVKPNITSKSMPVTVYLNENENIDMINIYDTMGRNIMSVPTYGEKKIQIGTSSLNKGMYVVKASNGNEACKIIIR